MTSAVAVKVAAILFFLVYAVLDQWAFRCQRVGRGILLVARDTAARERSLFGAIMPTQFVTAMWFKRLLWLACTYFSWKAWGWWALLPLLLYAFVLGAWVDTLSPWPSYSRLLALFKDRIQTGHAGLEALTLSSTINHIEQQLASVAPFEKVTTGAWLNRAAEAAKRANAADTASKPAEPT